MTLTPEAVAALEGLRPDAILALPTNAVLIFRDLPDDATMLLHQALVELDRPDVLIVVIGDTDADPLASVAVLSEAEMAGLGWVRKADG